MAGSSMRAFSPQGRIVHNTCLSAAFTAEQESSEILELMWTLQISRVIFVSIRGQ